MSYTINKEYQLKDYQRDVVDNIIAKGIDKYCLFMACGTGKTVVALELLKDVDNILIITTSKHYDSGQWESEAKKFYDREDITVINYEKIRGTKGKMSQTMTNLLRDIKKYDAIIVDECHKVKASSGRRANGSCKAVAKLTAIVPTVIGLTGTPISNSYADVYHIYRNLNIVEYEEFNNDEEFIMNYYNYYKIPLKWGYKLKPLGLKPNRVDDLMSRMDSKSVSYFPEIMDHTVNIIDIDAPLPNDYIDVTDAITTDNTLSIFSKMALLQQISNGFRFDHDYIESIDKKTGEPTFEKVKVGYTVVDTYKRKAFKKLITTSKDDDIILVYKFIPDLETMKEVVQELEDDGITLNVKYVYIGQSEALNLQAYNHVIFYSLNYSYKDYYQMISRILRLGQTRDCMISILKRKHTIEDTIITCIDNKKEASDLYKDYIANIRREL